MSTVLKYEYTCQDESDVVTELRFENDPVPTQCRRNSAHTIDPDSVSVLEVISQNKVTIDENSDLTGENFRFMQRNIPGNTGDQPTITEFMWPYPITVFDVQITPTDENYGDQVHLSVLSPKPDPPYDFLGYGGVAVMVAYANPGATAITVNSVDHIQPGYDVTLLTGPTGMPGMTSQHVGEVISVNKNTNQVVFENPLGITFGPNSIFRQEVFVTDNRGSSIGPPVRYPIGEAVIGGTIVPAGSKILVKYYNNSNDKNKTLHTIVEYRY